MERGRRDVLAGRPFDQPHPSRLEPANPHHDEILRRHRAALEHGERTYLDPASGFVVMTAATLAARGFCCENGCRHCPYVV